jgi:hypothetical protein
MLSRLLCAIGLHGPNVFGNASGHRSERSATLVRTCTRCGAVWHGTPSDVRGVRSARWDRAAIAKAAGSRV